MKTIALTLFAAMLGLAQSSSSTTTAPAKDTAKSGSAAAKKPSAKSEQPKANSQTAKVQPPEQSIPAGAKQVEPNLYRYTDSNGKTWNYRQTPFGISKWEATSTPASEPDAAPQPGPQSNQAKSEPVVVTDLGDSYRFEKNTPFGKSSWVRKKSELTDQEKALAGNQSNPNPPAASKPAGNQ
jgi:hypothetical protein